MDKDTASETVMEVEEGLGSMLPSECNLRPRKRKTSDSVNMEGNNEHVHSRSVRSKNEDLKNEVNSSCNGGKTMRDEDGNDDLRNEESGNTCGVGDLGGVESKHDDNNDSITKHATVSMGLGKDSVEKDPLAVSRNEADSSETRFDQCTVSPLLLKVVKDAGYENMTLLQEAILPLTFKGKDVLAKAKRGSGKTVTFLLLAIETVIKSPPSGCGNILPPPLVLIISPTMAHAKQTVAEASTLLKYHASISVRIVGGKKVDMQDMPCNILVGTLDQLSHHITNTPGFATRLMGIKLLVVDEVDLRWKSFLNFVEKINDVVPKDRQTLLFSVKVRQKVCQWCHQYMKQDHEVIDTVQESRVETLSQASVSLGLGKDSVEKDPLRVSLNESDFSETRFDQCTVSPLSLKGIKDAGYEKMTLVQEAILPVILKGKDVLANAKTGSGKTVTFLLLAIETVIKSPPSGCGNILPPPLVLIISPTKAHAKQTVAEARTLLKYHASISVRLVGADYVKMEHMPCNILVGTLDQLSHRITHTPGFATRLMGIKLLVVEEVDLRWKRFLYFVEKINDVVPKERQTLLFSATVRQKVRQWCHQYMKQDHEVIDTVQESRVETLSQASVSLGLGKDSVEKDPLRVSLNESDFSETRFDQCTVSPLSLKGIKDAGYEKMTLVQEAILPVILKGKDVLANAKTCSGKTVTFLLLAIETVIKSPPSGCGNILPPPLVLIISPTKAHVKQIVAEASTLLKYHASIAVRIVGGKIADMQDMPCNILVGTLDQLSHHITHTPGFATRLMGIKLLVIDEADLQLKILEKIVQKIYDFVPKERQTLLFSATATVRQEVRQWCHQYLREDHEVINTVQESLVETLGQNTLVHMVAPMDMHFSSLYALINQIADDVAFKVVVICKTLADTTLVVSFLRKLIGIVNEIHCQSPVTHVATTCLKFQNTQKPSILVTDVVSARSVADTVPTLVIQMGLPADREQYISDGGRIGNPAGKGKYISLIAPFEEHFLSTIKNFPVTKVAPPLVDPLTKEKVEKALKSISYSTKQKAYLAWLMLQSEHEDIARFKYRLAHLGHEFSRSMGCTTPPDLPNIVLDLLGVRNVPGM